MAAIEAAGGTVVWLERPGGVRLRLAVWPEGSRGVVLLLNGRTEFIEKYLEAVAALQARGFAVWTLDWRGQGGSTRPLPEAHANHVGHFDEYVGDLNAMLDRHVLPDLVARKLVLMGHSMGGHLGAHLLSRRGGLFSCAVLLAPMIDFLRGRTGPRWMARAILGGMCLVPGQRLRFGPGTRRVPDFERAFEGNRLTTCPERHAMGLGLLRDNPALAVGGATWGWLRAALDSVVALEDARVIGRIDMPVLVVMAGDERLVDNRATRRFAVRLPRGKMLKIEGARHELLREAEGYRGLLWQAIDEFLAPLV